MWKYLLIELLYCLLTPSNCFCQKQDARADRLLIWFVISAQFDAYTYAMDWPDTMFRICPVSWSENRDYGCSCLHTPYLRAKHAWTNWLWRQREGRSCQTRYFGWLLFLSRIATAAECKAHSKALYAFGAQLRTFGAHLKEHLLKGLHLDSTVLIMVTP